MKQQQKVVTQQQPPQVFVPNREASVLIGGMAENMKFVITYSEGIFKQNQVSYSGELKESTNDLIAQLRRLLDLLPK